MCFIHDSSNSREGLDVLIDLQSGHSHIQGYSPCRSFYVYGASDPTLCIPPSMVVYHEQLDMQRVKLYDFPFFWADERVVVIENQWQHRYVAMCKTDARLEALRSAFFDLNIDEQRQIIRKPKLLKEWAKTGQNPLSVTFVRSFGSF